MVRSAALIAVVLVAATAAARADDRAPRRWVSAGFGLGFPELGHMDVSVWPLRNVAVDGRLGSFSLGWAIAAGASVHVPVQSDVDVVVGARYGMAGVSNFLSSDPDEYRVMTFLAGVGRRLDTWEWRGAFAVLHADECEPDSDSWGIGVEFTFLMNFPRPSP